MIDLEAPIAEVTVYADQALVVRRGTVQLTAGEHDLRIGMLPQFNRDSLRANGRGPQGTRILNVDLSTAFHSRPPAGDLRKLQDELDQLEQDRQLIEARQAALNDRRQWLRALGEQSRDFAKGLAQGQMKPQDCADFLQFAATQALQDAEAAQGFELQLKRAWQEIGAKKRELAQLQACDQPDRLAAVITVSLAQEGELTLEVSYLIHGASWRPQYDVHVQMDDNHRSGEVELTYGGIVQQSTGEAWENVQLVLSTARPSQAAQLPELDPWYLDVSAPVLRAPASAPFAAQARAVYGGAAKPRQTMLQPAPLPAGAASALLADEDAVPEAEESSPPEEVSVATATVEQAGTALAFRVGRSVDIPSDRSPHKTTIARDRLPCSCDYVCAPALADSVHLRAAIVNSTERVLLRGEASIFLQSQYVGTTQLKQTAPAETFKVFLGIDDGIKVKRELIERSVEKGSVLQSGIRRITYAYRMTVHNYTATTRDIVIRDRLPVSKHEKVRVRVQSIQPTPKDRTKLELAVWQWSLAPDAEQKIEFQFVIEHPQDMLVTGLV
ncbi:MAG TPA: mucoidy inhibitor MuiA family protein [Ktedonobacteraceae bacterium]|jgi:uncharacterized protein (TIGR02231 family)